MTKGYNVTTPKHTIVFDFDGVLADYSDGWQGVEKIGKPLTRGIYLLARMKALGYRIVIYTCRTNPILNVQYKQEELVGFVRRWLENNLILYDEIYTGPGKPHASAYIDDKAVEFDMNSNIAYAMKKIRRLTGPSLHYKLTEVK